MPSLPNTLIQARTALIDDVRATHLGDMHIPSNRIDTKNHTIEHLVENLSHGVSHLF